MKKKGFTLIEVIIVITMLLILASFFIPKLTAYQNKAKKAKAINSARQIYEASLSSYIEQNGSFVEVKLIDNINTLTMVKVENSDVTVDNEKANISFQSDDVQYTVKINAKDNKYEVYCGSGETETAVFSNMESSE